MKIGIVTFNNALSYGAMLQAYALKTTISKMGFEVTVVNCNCSGNVFQKDEKYYYNELKKSSGNILKKYLKLFIFNIFQKTYYARKVEEFNYFRENYLYSNLNGKLDLYVCGSDQIWNPDITKGYYNLFFGINKENIPAISYAASVGDLKAVQRYGERLFFDKVKNLRNVSCRESDLNKFLLDNFIDSKIVLDPSLLLESVDYDTLIEEDTNYKKYIFVFALGQIKLLKDVAEYVSNKTGYEVIFLNGSGIPFYTDNRNFGDISPKKFLSYIKSAEYIFTDSFHGLALSIVYKKRFNVILPKLRKERLVNLLEVVGLKDRIIKDYRNRKCIDLNPIDYKDVDKKILHMKEESIRYLRDSIKKYQ